MGFGQYLKRNFKLLKSSEHGLEREFLRVKQDGSISDAPHPKSLGAPIANKYINTDFSDVQVELVTPAFKSESAALKSLEDVHIFVNENTTSSELFWPLSTPSKLPKKAEEIPLAQYGSSHQAAEKTLYRLGLSHRYGRKMQTISGVHYNFSFGDDLWNSLYKKFAQKSQSKKDFITQSYFRIAHNYLRLSWMDSYLFGATPTLHKSYLQRNHHQKNSKRNRPKKPLKKLDSETYFAEHATSLRMSSFGYCCPVQSDVKVCFNTLECYIRDLRRLTTTPYKAYQNFPGINQNVLQIPAEYYSTIRPKTALIPGKGFLESIEENGVKYLEIRSVDISPFHHIGVGVEHLRFLHILMLHCLIGKNYKMTAELHKQYIKNHERTALYGRRPGFMLRDGNKEIELKKWGITELDKMLPAAEMLDANHKDNRYTATLKNQINKFKRPSLTPSAQVLKIMREKEMSYLEFGVGLAKMHKQSFKKKTLAKTKKQHYEEEVQKSLIEKTRLESKSIQQTPGYEDLELSTQLLIKEAQHNNVEVEILDRAKNIIRLSKGRKSEIIQQATLTNTDSTITYLILENKAVAKKLLTEEGIKVPLGAHFHNKSEAIKSYDEFSKKKIVVKPTTTNYGIGINFVEPQSPQAFKDAVNEAFKHDESILVEEFIDGEEYRFLVIGEDVHSVLHRIPANVTGDGKSTIRQLVDAKNDDPTFYRKPEYQLKLNKKERDNLKAQKLTTKSVPKKGQTIFLRSNSNISTGGDSYEVSGRIPEKYSKIAAKAAKAADAKICGVDMIIGKKDYAIIEINFNPVLFFHAHPYRGEGKNVAKPVLKLLGF